MPATPPHGILHTSTIERAAIVDTYIERTHIQRDLESFWTALTTSTFLLPNPYPQLLRHMRLLEAKAQPNEWEFPAVSVKSVNIPPNTVNFGSVEGAVFGRAHFVVRVDGPRLVQLSKLLGCAWYKQQSDDGITVTTMTCIVGPAVLHGMGYLAALHSVQLEHHVLIEGDKLERAITMFAQMVAKDAFDTQTSASTINQGVWITTPSFKKSDKHIEKLWTLDAIQAGRVAFVSAVKTAVAARVPCYVTELRQAPLDDWSDEKTGPAVSYMRVRRTFVMHFKPPNEATRSFTSKPQRPIQEGVFFNEDAIKTYVTKVAQPDPAASPKPFVTPILASYASGNYLEMVFALVHHICVNDEALNAMPQLCKVTRGLPGQLVALARTSALIQEMLTLHITSLSLPQNHLKCLWGLLAEFANNLTALLHQRTHSWVIGVRRTLEALVEALDVGGASEPGVVQTNVDNCRRIELLLEHVAQCMTRDMIDTMSGDGAAHPIQLVNQLAQVAAHEERLAQAALTKSKVKASARTNDKATVTAVLVEPESRTSPLYGIDVDQEVQSAVASLTYPPPIAREAVYMQYIVDTRLDVAVEAALTSVISDGMPQNHFPPFIQHLRAFAIRHSMSLALAAPPRLPLHDHSMPPSDENCRSNELNDRIVEVKGLFGTPFSLSYLPGSVVSMAAKLRSWPMCTVRYSSPTARFTIEAWTSIYLRRYYSWLDDEPSQVDLIEHVQVTSVQPTLQLTQKASELFSDAVLQDVLNLADHPQMAVVWLQTADEHAFNSWASLPLFRVDADQLKLRRDLIRCRIEDAVRSKQWVQVCVYHSHTLVVKTYVLHLVDGSRRRCFAPSRLRSPQSCHVCFSRASAEWTRSLIDTSPFGDENVAGEGDLLDIYDLAFQTSLQSRDEFHKVKDALRVMLASPAVALKALETQGFVYATACTTKGFPLSEVKDGIQAWVARIRAVIDTPATQDMLWLVSRWKIPLENALADRDAAQAGASVEGLATFVLALRLGCQLDVHANSKLPCSQVAT